MISTWQPSSQELNQYLNFQSVSGIKGLYDTLKPTNQKVLETLVAQSNTEAKHDALKFQQRYIRALDNAKLIQFLRFTTASDALITNKIEVTFTKLEVAACRLFTVSLLHISELITVKPKSTHGLRSNNSTLLLPPTQKMLPTLGALSFAAAAPALWNKLPAYIRNVASLNSFKKSIKTFLFNKSF